MRNPLSFLSRSPEASETAQMVQQELQNQDVWFDRISACHWLALESGSSVSIKGLKKADCFGDEDGKEDGDGQSSAGHTSPFPGAQLDELKQAIKEHKALHEEIKEAHPLVWAFWAGSNTHWDRPNDPGRSSFLPRQDSGVQMRELIAMLGRLAEGESHTYPDYSNATNVDLALRGLGAYGEHFKNCSDDPSSPTYVPMSPDLYHEDLLSAGGVSLGVGISKSIHSGTQLSVKSGDPVALAEQLELLMGFADDPGRRAEFEAELEELRAGLASTAEAAEAAHSALTQEVNAAVELYGSDRGLPFFRQADF